jgi:uncharacterized protein (TIGR02246 family)
MSARSPEDCDRMFEQRVNAGDLEGLVALYEPRASFVPQQGDAATGTAAIREALAGLVAMKPKLKMGIKRVVTAGDDVAVVYNDWSMSAVGPDGAALDMVGKAIEIVRRQADGTWRFLVDDPFARS